jgi:hypothetical protein
MDAQALLKDVAQMPLLEMERFVQAVNGLITQKKTTDKSYRERFLLGKINQTVLGKEKTERYQLLIRKLESVTITDAEYVELMQLTDYEEKIRYERLTYLVELAELKSITLPQLMEKMGLNRPAHV